jgi:ribonuclease P protein component
MGFAVTCLALTSLLQHLKTPAEFAAVFEQGSTQGRSAHFVLHFLGAQATDVLRRVCVGVVTPKRWAKRAVTRNTIKRQIYAVSTALQPRLAPGCYVVRLRTEFSRKAFPSATSDALKKAARSELQALFAKVLA